MLEDAWDAEGALGFLKMFRDVSGCWGCLEDAWRMLGGCLEDAWRMLGMLGVPGVLGNS